MKRILALSTCFSLALAGAALAGEITSTLEVTGGSNAFAALKLLRADDGPREEGILKVQVVMTETQNLKGYGFVLNYDPAKYELVETQEVQENLLATGSGEPALFLSSNRTPGRVTVGARVTPSAGALAIVTVTATAIAVRDQGPPFVAYVRLS